MATVRKDLRDLETDLDREARGDGAGPGGGERHGLRVRARRVC